MIKFTSALFIVLFAHSVYADTPRADVIKVWVSGESKSYRFAVTLKSDETGCEQYADWWEVLSEDGELLHRRILMHSHPDTQPFTRSGSKININPKQLVYIRAHMNKLGYIGDVFKGSVQGGFKKVQYAPNFPKNLDSVQPLPKACLY